MIPESFVMYKYCFCMFFASGLLGHFVPALDPFMTKICESHFFVGMGLFWVNSILLIGSCIGGAA